MAQHHRFTQPHGAETAMIVIVQITAADSAPGQTEPHLTRSRLFLRPVFDAHILCPVGDNRFHDNSRSSARHYGA
ncbi:hypothetical protein QE453_001174 [Agrobacterium sp. SORGH_AS440]|nr:hypothetical protein [Agrobacterium sp. SORGH_AS_0440]